MESREELSSLTVSTSRVEVGALIGLQSGLKSDVGAKLVAVASVALPFSGIALCGKLLPLGKS